MEDATIAAEIIRLTALVMLTAALPAPVLAAPTPPTSAADDRGVDSAAPRVPLKAAAAGAESYTNLSDEKLTALAARWDALDKMERRALLTEMKLRMARNGRQDAKALIHIRTERRYGRIIRDPDGRLIRIETQVVQVRPLTSGEPLPRAFGIGFEHRVGARRGAGGRDGGAPAGVTEQAEADAGALPRSPAPLVIEDLPPPAAPRVEPFAPLYRVADPAP